MTIEWTGLFGTNFEIGVAALSCGDYEAALKEFRPVAEQGHASAQTLVGAISHRGHGVPQDAHDEGVQRRAPQFNA